MTVVTPDEHGVSDCHCDCSHWILVHDGSKVLAMGQWRQSTSKKTIEYFDTEMDMLAHILVEGLQPLAEEED